jgi:hypothetical protein
VLEGDWLQISSQLSAKKINPWLPIGCSNASGRFGFGLIGLIVELCGLCG